jgi:hypothetical protein
VEQRSVHEVPSGLFDLLVYESYVFHARQPEQLYAMALSKSPSITQQVLGNSRSHIFEWPGCPYYSDISPDNRVPFASPQGAEAVGYRPAHDC